MNLFFDFDGTLIDSKKRLYTLFQDLVPQSNLSYEEYWKFKRNRISNEEILINNFGYKQEDIPYFCELWMKLIEREEYLSLDTPIPGVDKYLKALNSKGYSINLVTARQSKNRLKDQLKNLGWDGYFDNILVTEQILEKSELIKPYVKKELNNFIIGDTGRDILAGRKLGINTVAVLTGFQSKKMLEIYKPDLIIESAICFNTKL